MRLDASSPEVFLNASHGIGVVDGECKHWQRLPWNLYHRIIANSPEFSMSHFWIQLLKDIKKILNLKMTAKLIIHLRMTVKRYSIKGSRKESQFSVILSFFFSEANSSFRRRSRPGPCEPQTVLYQHGNPRGAQTGRASRLPGEFIRAWGQHLLQPGRVHQSA